MFNFTLGICFECHEVVNGFPIFVKHCWTVRALLPFEAVDQAVAILKMYLYDIWRVVPQRLRWVLSEGIADSLQRRSLSRASSPDEAGQVSSEVYCDAVEESAAKFRAQDARVTLRNV